MKKWKSVHNEKKPESRFSSFNDQEPFKKPNGEISSHKPATEYHSHPKQGTEDLKFYRYSDEHCGGCYRLFTHPNANTTDLGVKTFYCKMNVMVSSVTNRKQKNNPIQLIIGLHHLINVLYTL